ncbi:MAG: 4Fe-4S binding protein [Euryarchaeota archaeon]|nr:4Fe-4S binding protein [Euryarchaeota archaeon]
MKPRVAIFDFASCEGCELQIANLEEQVADLVQAVDIVSFREVMKEHSGACDIAFIEGSIQRPMDEERIKKIRANAKVLVALGDCACTGCVNKMRNELPVDDALRAVYGNADVRGNELFDLSQSRAIDEVVNVDFYIRGCPVRKEQVLYYVQRFFGMPPQKNLDLRFGINARGMDDDRRSIVNFDPNKCIMCRRCEVVCNEALDVHAIAVANKGFASIMTTPFDIGMDNNKCISCGQCLVNCPVGAYSEVSEVDKTLKLLEDRSNYVVFVIDPIALTSCMDSLPTDETNFGIVVRKLISALKAMKAKEVVDFTQFTYLSIAAQGEYIQNHRDAAFTSWCPSASTYLEKFYPQYAKFMHKESSPENIMLKVLRKRHEVENLKIVFVTPCIVHKSNGAFDAVLTSRELPRLLATKEMRLDFHPHLGVTFDCDLGMIQKFVSGGVSDYTYSLMILKAAYLSKFKNLDAALTIGSREDFIHELTFDSELGVFNALVIEDMSKLRKYLGEDIAKYNVIEFYPCFRGCLTGGGQCLTTSEDEVNRRRARLKSYKGEMESPYEFVSQLISVYDKVKGGI